MSLFKDKRENRFKIKCRKIGQLFDDPFIVYRAACIKLGRYVDLIEKRPCGPQLCFGSTTVDLISLLFLLWMLA